ASLLRMSVHLSLEKIHRQRDGAERASDVMGDAVREALELVRTPLEVLRVGQDEPPTGDRGDDGEEPATGVENVAPEHAAIAELFDVGREHRVRACVELGRFEEDLVDAIEERFDLAVEKGARSDMIAVF